MATVNRWHLPIARDGWKFILPLLGLSLVVLAFQWMAGAVIAACGALVVAAFFRDPERKPPRIEGAVVAPADGRVVAIEEVDHEDFPSGRAKRVSIFLSLFNVHINRAPLSSRVESVEHLPGRFRNALTEASARENERNRIAFRQGPHEVVVDQIAGLIARRVVCSCRSGDELERGQRIGLIRFGSRTDTYLPLEADVRVKKGMKVRGGESVLAILPANKGWTG